MMKRSVTYAAALAVVLAGSVAVPAQAAMKMVVVGGGSCGQGSTCPSQDSGSCSGQISLNDLLSGISGRPGSLGGSGCAIPWNGSLSGWRIPGGICIGGGCGDDGCPADCFWDPNCTVGGGNCGGSTGCGGNGGGSAGCGGNWGCPDITIPDQDVPGTDLPGQWQPDTDPWYPSYDEDLDISGYLQQVVDLVNQERSKAGLPALEESAQLSSAAAVRAQEIVTSFGHVRPDGSSFSTAIAQKGVSFNGAGENIAYGQSSPAEVMNAWMNSQSHREAILNRRYTDIGVACYQDSNGVLYWTQLFTY